MIFTIHNNARKSATLFRVIWVVSGLSEWPQRLRMCVLRSLGMDEIDLYRRMGIDMILGSHSMIFTIWNNAWKNVAKFGYFKLFLGSDGVPEAPDVSLRPPWDK